MNARPSNNQLITYYLPVCYLLRMQQYPVNTTYNNMTQNRMTLLMKWRKTHVKTFNVTGSNRSWLAINFGRPFLLCHSGWKLYLWWHENNAYHVPKVHTSQGSGFFTGTNPINIFFLAYLFSLKVLLDERQVITQRTIETFLSYCERSTCLTLRFALIEL